MYVPLHSSSLQVSELTLERNANKGKQSQTPTKDLTGPLTL